MLSTPIFEGMSGTLIHPEVTDGDMLAVRELLEGLLEDFRRQEREKHVLAAIVTWVNAFSSFKRLRNRIGLPIGSQQALYYGAFTGSLKATGKLLEAWLQTDGFDPCGAGIKMADLHACVQELIEDDRVLDSGLLDSDFSDLEKKFCEA
jgi:hypothetical protein